MGSTQNVSCKLAALVFAKSKFDWYNYFTTDWNALYLWFLGPSSVRRGDQSHIAGVTAAGLDAGETAIVRGLSESSWTWVVQWSQRDGRCALRHLWRYPTQSCPSKILLKSNYLFSFYQVQRQALVLGYKGWHFNSHKWVPECHTYFQISYWHIYSLNAFPVCWFHEPEVHGHFWI